MNVTEATLRVVYSPDVAHGAGSIYWKVNWGSQRDNGVINSPATLFMLWNIKQILKSMK